MTLDQPAIESFWSKVDKNGPLPTACPELGPCWVWSTKSKDWDGHGLFNFSRAGKKHNFRAHRLSWLLSTGEEPGKSHVCHKCDNPPCCNPAHLFLGDAKANFHDCLAKGRYTPKGKGNAAAVLNEDEVLQIRELWARGGWSQQAIADIFGVRQNSVSRVVLRQTWAHI
jgi:hypothetical protein